MQQNTLDKYKEIASEPTDDNLKILVALLREDIPSERAGIYVAERDSLVTDSEGSVSEDYPLTPVILEAAIDTGCGFLGFEPEDVERTSPTGSIEVTSIRYCLCLARRNATGEPRVVGYLDRRSAKSTYTDEDMLFLEAVLKLL